MPTHAPSEPVQIRYPGGKDGWYRVECVLGDYDATEADPARATKRARAHATAKNAREAEVEAPAEEEKTYRVVRFYQDSHPRRVIAEGLSLVEARDWCRDPETSSATATVPDNVKHTEEYGNWFDGYEEEA